MTAGAPWSVKGIDPKAREVAKELARRSGVTLGEWLNRVILEDDVPEEISSEAHFTARPARPVFETARAFMPSPSFSRPDESPGSSELDRITQALNRLTDRIESSEMRTGLAISGIEHSVRHTVARLEAAERETLAVASRQDAAAERAEAEQARVAERLRRMEAETSGPRSAEALRALEERTHGAIAAIEQRLDSGERAALGDPAGVIEGVIGRLGQRMADAEGQTAAALDGLRGSLAQLDRRIASAEAGHGAELNRRLESLAEDLTRRVEDARSEIAQRMAASGSTQVEARIGELAAQVSAAEQRSARAIEAMGREVISIAETLNRRVQSAEQRSAEAIEQVGGEIARIAGAVETRLGQGDQLHAEALERLGAEIGRITERLTDRIIQSERRAAQAIDDVGEQVSRVTERIEQRHERASSDLAERIRQSEERTARILEEARLRISGATAAEAPDAAPAPDLPEPTAAFGPELFSRAEPISQPALDPGNPSFGEEDFAAADAFAPIAEVDDVAPEPPVEPSVRPERDLDVKPPPLSTREVIEQARATARAAAAAGGGPAPGASERRVRPASRGFFSALKPGRSTSNWQTALMVAVGAAFLSIGGAGVVLLDGSGVKPAPSGAKAPEFAPRAAVALMATPPSDTASEATPASAAQSPDAVQAEYLQTLRALSENKPGALGRLKALADAGHTPAQLTLAQLYEAGQSGVAQNLSEARRWTARAADAGDASAMHNLALYHFRGEGGPADSAAAARWFRKAAERGVVDSQFNLGMLYQTGSGVPRDEAEAYKWFSIAANGGDGPARASAIELGAKLTSVQLAAAERAANTFRPMTPATAVAAPATAIASAQKVLGRLGYYNGPSNGAASPELKLAVAAYQRDQGLAVTGLIDPATASRLAVFTR